MTVQAGIYLVYPPIHQACPNQFFSAQPPNVYLFNTNHHFKKEHACQFDGIFLQINCALLVTWKPNCIFLLLKYHTSNNLMDMSALPVAINRPSGLKRAHLATFYKIKEIQLSIIVQHLSILIIIIIKVGCNNKNIQQNHQISINKSPYALKCDVYHALGKSLEGLLVVLNCPNTNQPQQTVQHSAQLQKFLKQELL